MTEPNTVARRLVEVERKLAHLPLKDGSANARTDAVAERISRLETASERLRADVLDRLPPVAKPQR